MRGLRTSMRRIPPRLAVPVIIGSLAVLALVTFRLPPNSDRSLHESIGAALAKQTLAVASPQSHITVITRDTDAFPQPTIDSLMRGFQKELGRAGVKLGSIQRLQLDPLRPSEVPPGDFYERIRRGTTEQVVVSFLGPPLLSAEQWTRIGRVKPRIIAFCPGPISRTVDLQQLMAAGYLHGAIVSRPPGRGVQPAKSKRGFDDLYIAWSPTGTEAQDSTHAPSKL
jgi:hypothetical protein